MRTAPRPPGRSPARRSGRWGRGHVGPSRFHRAGLGRSCGAVVLRECSLGSCAPVCLPPSVTLRYPEDARTDGPW